MALNESIIFSDEQINSLLKLKNKIIEEEKEELKIKEKSKIKTNEKK